ncbi:MAG TPA: 50S ribosomal protein L11 methyltransferase [Polyangiaceae bacterium]|jgi:ribosomal protein L11 methyltransferase
MLARLVVSAHKRLFPQLSRALFAAGAGAVEELARPSRLVVYAAARDEVEQIGERMRAALELAGLARRVTLSVDVDEASRWETAWTRHLGPVALTPRLTIQPSWDETPAPQGAERIWFEPELAFGDGAHVTTRLAARAVEEFCAAHQGIEVCDYGSGTGVLSFVALRSGARATIGLDIDPVAISAARKNAELNQLSLRARFELCAEFDEEIGAPLVVANLELPALLATRAELARVARNSELLLLSGFLSECAAQVATAFAECGFIVVRERHTEGWALLELVLGN